MERGPQQLYEWLAAEIVVRTGVPRQEIDPDERLSRYGLDSIAAARLISDLGTQLGQTLSPTLFWHYPTINALAGHLSADRAAAAPTQEGLEAERLEPIAIVGMACRFPGGRDVREFWKLLIGGKEAIGEVPAARWDAASYYSRDPQAPGKMITRRAGFLSDVDQFDAACFSMSPREAAEVDPQQRLALEVCWEGLEDAGVPIDALRGSATGVFMGAIWHDYADLHRQADAAITAHTGLGQALDIIANRVSYTLGLQGPSMTIDTACSSSLVAIHLACQSLRNRESTLALAGGVSLMLSPDTMVALSKFGGLSPDGRSMAFDKRANGFARGEGAGVVVLKRLSVALAAGDRIYCWIRGSAVNNDGFSNGLSAPNPAAQESVLREAYRRSGVAPSAVHYVEAHGTGTALGDPIEVRALGAVLGPGRTEERPLAIGSVKTNIGHLEGASGIAGVIKTALAIHHRTIPASLHFEQPNPDIPFQQLRVKVQSACGTWPGAGPAIAGVSSFGWGGTNSHLVLEGYGGLEPMASSRVAPLQQVAGGLVFVCSPYGPQWPGMGRELMAREPAFRAKLEECDRALRPLTGWSVVEELGSFQAGERWKDVSVVQPLLFAFQVALAAQWRALGIVPDAVVGHSLGEISAAYIAGALDLQDAALIIHHYSRLQAQQAGGGMAIVGLAAGDLEKDLERFDGQAVIAAHNSPRTTVLSGNPAALQSLVAYLSSRGVYCSAIDINVAAHSPQIEPIMEELRERLAGIVPRVPSMPMVSTLSGAPVTGAALDADYWARNLRNPVLLAEAMAWLLEHGYTTFVELSPHPVMGHALEESIATARQEGIVLPSCRRDEGESSVLLRSRRALSGRNAPAEPDRPVHVLTLSAKTAEALRELASRHAAILTDESWKDVCYSANTGRTLWNQRLAVWARSAAEMRERLLSFAAGSQADGIFSQETRKGSVPRVTFLVSAEGDWERAVPRLLRDHPRIRPLLEHASVDVAGTCRAALENLWRSWGVIPEAFVVERGDAAGEVVELTPSGAEWERLAEALCRLWTSGIQVNWREFDQDHPRRRVALPSYPFQRTRFWFMPGDRPQSTAPAEANRLLGRRVRSALKPVQFEGQLSSRQPGFLADHRFGGGVLVPTAAYLDMALTAAADALGPGEWQVEGMTLQEPLYLSVDPAHRLSVILEADRAGTHRFRVFSQTGGSDVWSLHVDGSIGTRRPASNAATRLSEAQSRCRAAVDVDEWYREFDRAGLHYGPEFRKVQQLWRGAREALGRIEAQAQSCEMTTMLDAAFQVVFAALPHRPVDGQPCAYLPVSLERFYWREPRSRLWSFATVRRQDGTSLESFTSDVTLFDEAGGVVAELTGLHLRRTEGSGDSQAWTEWLYRVEWREQGLPRSGGESGLEKYGELAPRLNELAGAYVVNTLLEVGLEFRLGTRFVASDLPRVTPAHRRVLGSMLEMLEEGGFLQRDGDHWRVVSTPPRHDPHAMARSIRQAFPGGGPEVALLERLGELLPNVLTGGCDALQVLFPSGSLALAEAFYADSAFSRTANASLRDTVASAIETSGGGRLRVLEIGAGTGSATATVLPLLPAGRTEYVFSDVSPIFLGHGKKKFGTYPFIRYELIDVEREPTDYESYDVVIAANVLHATADLRKSLRHIARMVKRDGSLVLLEVTQRDRWVDLVFGLTDGWWKFSDRDLRPAHALLSAGKWLQVLEEVGFAGITAVPEHGGSGQTVLLARKPGPRELVTDSRHAPWWILEDKGGLGREASALLEARGCRPVLVPEDCGVPIPPGGLGGVIHLTALDSATIADTTAETLAADQERSCRRLLEIVQALVKSGESNRRGIWVVTRGAQPVEGEDSPVSIAQSAMWGLGRVVANEHPEHWGGMIDLDPVGSSGDAQRIVNEVMGARGEDQLAYRGGKRQVARLARVRAGSSRPKLRFRSDGSYLITGGLGGLGLALVPWMVERGARHVALAGRRAPSAETRRVLEGLNGTARVTVYQADVSCRHDVEVLLRAIEADQPLAGVFHAAGVLHDSALLQQDWIHFEKVAAPKVLGSWNLHELTAELPLEWFVLFSSQAALLGSAGQANHAAANAFMDGLAHYRRAAGLPATSINWGAWARIGAAAQADLASYFASHGMTYIEPREGLAALEYLLQAGAVQRAVSDVNWDKFAESTAAGRSAMFRELVGAARHDADAAQPWHQEPHIRNFLRGGSPEERRHALVERVREQAQRVLRLDSRKFDAEQPLIELGLDSLMAIELKNHIESQLGVRLPVVKILEGASARQLAERLMEQMEVESLIESVQAERKTEQTDAEWDLSTL